MGAYLQELKKVPHHFVDVEASSLEEQSYFVDLDAGEAP